MGAVGIRIWKMSLRFPNFLGGRKNLGFAPLLGDVLTLPVQLRPPERGIVVDIGALCRYWEGGFVSGGQKRHANLGVGLRPQKEHLGKTGEGLQHYRSYSLNYFQSIGELARPTIPRIWNFHITRSAFGIKLAVETDFTFISSPALRHTS